MHAVALREEDMPPAFARWLADNRIDPRVYTLNNKLPRYVRRNPRLPQPSAAELSEQLGACQPASAPAAREGAASAGIAQCARGGSCWRRERRECVDRS